MQCQEGTRTNASGSLTLFYFLACIIDYTGVLFIDVYCIICLYLCIFSFYIILVMKKVLKMKLELNYFLVTHGGLYNSGV